MIIQVLSRHLVFVVLAAFVFLFSAFSAEASTTSAKPSQKKLIAQALKLADQGKNQKALNLLNSSALKTAALKDELNLHKARIAFNLKLYKKSHEYYQLITKKSPQWLSSVEERAWVKIYLGQINEAIADSHTLMSPLFNDVVGPEAYHLSAFVAHQVCDFTRVFKIIETFKKTSVSRIQKIEADLKQKRNLKNTWELKHYSNVISQLHLIEADAIQRIYLDKKLAGERSNIGNVAGNDQYDLQFPYEEEDVWIDEVDQLKVDAKNCPIPFKKVVAL